MNDDPQMGKFIIRQAAHSHRGIQRITNQDAYHIQTQNGLLALIADGVGGEQGGEIASQVAIQTLLATWTSTADEMWAQNAVNEAHQAVKEAARAHGHARIATTIAGLYLHNTKRPQITVFNVGDTRIYTIHDHALELVSVDHVRQDALTRFLGQNKEPEVYRQTIDLQRCNRWLLCSDGLWKGIAAERFAHLASQRNVERAADDLLAAALEAGASDNVTLLLVDIYVVPFAVLRWWALLLGIVVGLLTYVTKFYIK